MGKLLISKRSIKSNKELKVIQKEYLKANRHIRGKYPKGKLGKVVALKSNECMDCTKNKRKESEKLNILENMKVEEIWDRIQKSDIRGLSGSNFPTIKKLETVKNSSSAEKYFIINAVACDPGLLHDSWLISHHRQEIEIGIEIIKRLIPFQKVILAEPNKVPNRYPMGEERILIKQLLGREIAKEEIPAKLGYLVLNVQTVYAIYKAVCNHSEKDMRYITVANIETGAARIVKVEIGQHISELIPTLKRDLGVGKDSRDSLEGLSQTYIGMGIMDADIATEESIISAKTGFIGFGIPVEFNNEAKCKGCGACSRRCPKGIKVHKLIRAIEKEEVFDFGKYQLDQCISCGTCSYYCKAGKNTMEILEKAKEKYYGK